MNFNTQIPIKVQIGRFERAVLIVMHVLHVYVFWALNLFFEHAFDDFENRLFDLYVLVARLLRFEVARADLIDWIRHININDNNVILNEFHNYNFMMLRNPMLHLTEEHVWAPIDLRTDVTERLRFPDAQYALYMVTSTRVMNREFYGFNFPTLSVTQHPAIISLRLVKSLMSRFSTFNWSGEMLESMYQMSRMCTDINVQMDYPLCVSDSVEFSFRLLHEFSQWRLNSPVFMNGQLLSPFQSARATLRVAQS